MKTQSSLSISIKTYFYQNAIYLGATKSMSRIGTGIILFHNDTCAIVSYNNNSQLNGHCIFYRRRCLISAKYQRNRITSVAYRIDGFLLFLKYNQKLKIHGNCFIISYLQQTIHQLKYQQGQLKNKIKIKLIDGTPAQDIFIYHSYHLIFGQEHHRALTHQITTQDIKNIRMKKSGNKVQVYYSDRETKKLQNEIGFQFIYRIPQNGGYDMDKNKYKDQFQLYFIQKGLSKFNKLDGYGQRVFKNSNQYQGYFQSNVFHGEGTLKNYQKGNWVYGIFQKGQMIDILDFSNNDVQQAKYKNILQNLRRSQLYSINEIIQQNNFNFLDIELEKVYTKANVEQQKIITFQDRKLDIMRKIASKFIQNQNQSELQPPPKPLKTPTKQTTILQQKQYKHTIRSLLSHSVSPKKYSQTDQNQDKTQPSNLKLTLPNKYLKSLQNQQILKTSKIFKKNYAHLQTRSKKNQKSTIQSNIIKLHKIPSKQKKYKIFTNKKTPKHQISEFSIDSNQSPAFSQTKRTRPLTTTPSPYKRRSPYRKSTIFQSTIKLKKIPKPSTQQQTPLPNIDQSLGIHRLQQIRRVQTDRKSLQKNRIKKSQKIFQYQKQKQSNNHGQFIYLHQNNQQNQFIQSNSPSQSSQNQSLFLKARKFLMPKQHN